MRRQFALVAATVLGCSAPLGAATPSNGGPYNALFLQGGIGIERSLASSENLARAGAPYTLSAWVRPTAVQPGRFTLIALGDPLASCRCLDVEGGRLLAVDGSTTIRSSMLAAGQWTHIALISDGSRIRLYVNGKPAGQGNARSASVAPRIGVAPVVEGRDHFGGSLVGARIDDMAMSATEVAQAYRNRPSFDLVQMWKVGQGWEWQKTANTGYWQQQDPWTLPKSQVAYSPPVALPVPTAPELQPAGDDRWIVNGWQLAAAPGVKADGAALSLPGHPTGQWYAATVPGTVLATLVDRGVYPDPYYGLNNLRIPESLARQNYWYRTSFRVPPEAAGKRIKIVFNGINYASQVWANGQRLGGTSGAFIRGQFDLVPVADENVIAVQVMPPPHPGIPHEQSIAAGVGENGGQLAIDGPTFVATEGWDWIPGIRDRNTGIWLPVELVATGPVGIGDPHVVTDLPLPNIDSADIFITVPLHNGARVDQRVTVTARFDDVAVEQSVIARPGASEVRFTPAQFPQLHVLHPRLWWPNGYGDPALHDLALEVRVGGAVSATKKLRFGIREVSYDLSLFDGAGHLRRVNVQPTEGGLKGEKLIDVTHTGIKQSPHGFVESLTTAGERSSGVVDVAESLPEPHLVIRVNGVKIAARGGSWGMDDAMKRSGRDRLEPYFRLEREAHMNIIRNWMGTNTEPQFYDLADENGMMVLNDFWQSTQNFQVEPEDPQLFIAN
ncbi:MAG: LamG-like jellyroll fold domain-containing protein, partial [Sphingomicrobium sp.]